MPAPWTIVQCGKGPWYRFGEHAGRWWMESCNVFNQGICNLPLMKPGSRFMFYCASRRSTLSELLFSGPMRRFTFQTGSAILSVLVVSLAAPGPVAGQNAPSADSSTPAVTATAQNAPAQQTSADTPSASAAPEPESSDVLTLFPIRKRAGTGSPARPTSFCSGTEHSRRHTAARTASSLSRRTPPPRCTRCIWATN